MTTIELTTRLAAPIGDVWNNALRSAVLIYVSRGRIRLRPVDPPELPRCWTAGKYRLAIYVFGVIPLGVQTIGIEFPPVQAPQRAIRDNGHGGLFRTWDHWIILESDGASGTLYSDRVTIDAGIFTALLAPVVRHYYAHRQRRWRRLVSNGFDVKL